MIDPGTGLTILGSAIGGAKIAEKILGPTSEYIGEQLREWTEKRVNNTAKIFKNAQEKLGDKMKEEGTVSPKVLKGILEDGGWCEEELQVEYFGGVLASSRSGSSRDDRGAYFVSLVTKLSTYQLRTHYCFYSILKRLFNGEDINIHDGNIWRDLEIFIPYETFYDALDLTKEESKDWNNILSHSVWGLNKEELITGFSYGGKDYLQKRFDKVEEGGVIFSPTKLGVDLYMWAFGNGLKNTNEFFSDNLEFHLKEEIKIGRAISTKKV